MTPFGSVSSTALGGTFQGWRLFLKRRHPEFVNAMQAVLDGAARGFPR